MQQVFKTAKYLIIPGKFPQKLPYKHFPLCGNVSADSAITCCSAGAGTTYILYL
jgi:hypothetical protein